jgi:hypothetical protein
MKRLFVAFTVAIFATGLAAQELKNVHLLKGLTPTQFQRTMNMIRSSVRVHCHFCHVAGDKEWDFASDEKPQKKRARR